MPTLISPSWEIKPGGSTLTLSVPGGSTSGRLWARTSCQQSLTLPACSSSMPCPSSANYIYCQAGVSKGGCSINPFSLASCSSQCVSPAAGNSSLQPSYTYPGFAGCATGDCNGQEVCSVSGDSPASLFEWTFNADGKGLDVYDLSIVDGYNVAIQVDVLNAQSASEACDSPRCKMDTNLCPPELRVGSSCLSICSAVHSSTQRAAYPILQHIYDEVRTDGRLTRDLVCCACGSKCQSNCNGCGSHDCAFGCSPYVTTYPQNSTNFLSIGI